jgi:hypothetical protein
MTANRLCFGTILRLFPPSIACLNDMALEFVSRKYAEGDLVGFEPIFGELKILI